MSLDGVRCDCVRTCANARQVPLFHVCCCGIITKHPAGCASRLSAIYSPITAVARVFVYSLLRSLVVNVAYTTTIIVMSTYWRRCKHDEEREGENASFDKAAAVNVSWPDRSLTHLFHGRGRSPPEPSRQSDRSLLSSHLHRQSSKTDDNKHPLLHNRCRLCEEAHMAFHERSTGLAASVVAGSLVAARSPGVWYV